MTARLPLRKFGLVAFDTSVGELEHLFFRHPDLFGVLPCTQMGKYHPRLLLQAVDAIAQGGSVAFGTSDVSVTRSVPLGDLVTDFVTTGAGFVGIGSVPSCIASEKESNNSERAYEQKEGSFQVHFI